MRQNGVGGPSSERNYRIFNESERHADGKMEGEIAFEAWIGNGIVPAVVFVGGMDGFHTAVEPQDEIVEIQAQAQSVGDGYLAPELIELELTAWLVLVFAKRPDIAGIDENRAV